MTTSSSQAPEEFDPTKFWTAPARNFRTSGRLHLQHFLMQNTLGYLLEPAVEKSLAASSQPLKVADLGCGNGVWLTELHSQLGDNVSAQLDGFDVNPVNFPDAAYLPASVRLQKFDVLADTLPAEMIGVYDLVHIRAFVSMILDGNLRPLLSVVLKLLKPGGFLQWEETRGDKWIVESPSPAVSQASCDNIVQILLGSQKAQGVSNDWVEALDSHFEQLGFQDTRLLVQEKRKQDYKGWTEDYLMVWEEIAAFFPSKTEAPDAPLTREAWITLFANAVRESEQGVVVHQGRVFTAVGRKQ